ncbi:MAG: hypothetical protein R6U11_00820, partial [Bacteroidales bacterium]
QNESHRALEKRRKSWQSRINLFTGFTVVFQFIWSILSRPWPARMFYSALLGFSLTSFPNFNEIPP